MRVIMKKKSFDSCLYYFTNPLDIKNREKLYTLMQDWKKVISTKQDIVFKDNGKPYPTLEYFNNDGFFFRQ